MDKNKTQYSITETATAKQDLEHKINSLIEAFERKYDLPLTGVHFRGQVTEMGFLAIGCTPSMPKLIYGTVKLKIEI